MTEDGKFKVKERKETKTTGKKCPDCEKHGRNGELVERSNKSSGNKFLGCSKYPACKYSEPLDGSPSPKKYTKKAEVKEEEDTGTGSEELDLSIDGEDK